MGKLLKWMLLPGWPVWLCLFLLLTMVHPCLDSPGQRDLFEVVNLAELGRALALDQHLSPLELLLILLHLGPDHHL